MAEEAGWGGRQGLSSPHRSTYFLYFNLFRSHACEVSIIIPILQVSKPRLRKAKLPRAI